MKMGQKKKIKSIGCFLLALMVCVNISPPVHAEETRAETETGYNVLKIAGNA